MYLVKIVFALIFILIVSVYIPSSVFAADIRGSNPKPVTLGGFSLTPTIGGYFFAGSEQRDATPSYGLKTGYDIIRKSVADSLGIEGTLNYFTTKSKTDASDASGYLFRLDAIYPFILRGKWMPFIAIGAGGIVIDTVSHADINPLFNYGAGLKYFLEDYLALRVDVRHLLVFDNANTRNNFEAGIGMSYYFGKERKKKPVPPPATKKEEREDAKNGKKTNGTAINSALAIPALEDIAITTGEKAEVEKKLVVKGETIAYPQSPPLFLSIAMAPLLALESAAKPHFLAEAPQESSGKNSVVREGSPAKGAELSQPVPPEKEAPAAGKIEATSQTAPAKDDEPVRQAIGKKVVRKLSVEFDKNSFYIKPKFHKILRETADIMKRSVDASAQIEGHSDSTWKLDFNIKLSEQRAQSVRSALIKLGIDPGRISTVGYGPARPIADNATIKGRQKNRRAVTLVTITEYAPKIKAEQELPPRIKPEAERRENERGLADKHAKASIKAAITLHESAGPVPVGSTGTLPMEISNKGNSSEEFLLTITAADVSDAKLVSAYNPDEIITRLQLAAGEKFKGSVVFRVPAVMADGHRSVITINAVSATSSDVSFRKETTVISSAPLLRAVAKLARQKVTPGEKLGYHVTVLNEGSLPARNLAVRLHLPPQIEFQGTTDVPFKQESNGTLVFKVDHIETGKMAEINLDVKIREDSAIGQELVGLIEVINGSLQKKDIFTATASVVQAK